MADFIQFTHLPFSKKLKPQLVAIASAMGLVGKTVPALRQVIQAHMRAHPELADEPKFFPLFSHRAESTPTGKNSSDKANEETSQVPITTGAITGANRTLIERKVKTDPPGQFARLFLNENNGGTSTETPVDKDSDSESDSDSSSSCNSPAPEVEEKQTECLRLFNFATDQCRKHNEYAQLPIG
ncbi:hypothetical protein B0H14DRAFT_2573906 [Mycena olivaceomarginata]|nr:hypothetical protein B0H14DRAFT_2573906 [Mycena olivaceomarginata]